jgi:LacI family transcriptional regulator/LacI family sucrose operon transcriptional repressor
MATLTMTEIARRSGVSQATVSRVLSGRGGVVPEKAEAVLKVAKSVDFRHKRKRSRLGSGLQNIGLLYTGHDFDRSASPLYCKYNTIARSLPKEFNAVLLPAELSHDELQREIGRRGIVGLLLSGYQNPPGLRKLLERIPHAWLNSHDDRAVNSILQGNEVAGRLAADYLLGKGCTRLGAIRVPSHNPGYAARIDGFLYEAYTKGLEALVFPCGEETQYFENIDWGELESIMDRTFEFLAERIARCDGFFCPDDRVTAILYRILHKHDISLFSNIRVVSCNNDQRCLAGLYPRPASIDFAPELTAKLAIEELLRQLNGESQNDKVSIVVQPELIKGEGAESFG